jgi:hypothetical protein
MLVRERDAIIAEEEASDRLFIRLERSELCYSASPLKKEADRLVQEHKAGPKPSTFHRKDDDYG